MTSRVRLAVAVGVTTVAALVSASPALAIVNGVPDVTDHPSVGLLALEYDGVKDAWCSRAGTLGRVARGPLPPSALSLP